MQSGNEIWPVYTILQNNFFYQEFYEKCGLETSSRPLFNFQRILCKKIFCGDHYADLDKF